MVWDPEQYLTYRTPRLRPAADLLGRIGATEPGLVVDLGCGAGNVTALLARRWPAARIVGVDNSKEMLAAAADAGVAGAEWVHGNITTWEPPARPGVVFSNATLHWLDDHARLLPRLAGWTAPGGWLGVQMPHNHHASAHQLLFEAVRSGPWAPRLTPHLRTSPVAEAAWYHGLLAPLAADVDIWETTYLHRLSGADPVLEWTRGSVLRPLLAELDADEQERFTAEYGARLREAYPPRPDGTTLFPFRRLFIVARMV